MAQGYLAIVLTREDEGLLQPCVANLRRIGFDHVLVACIEDFADRLAEVEALFAAAEDVSVHPVRPPFDEATLFDLSGPHLGPVLERHRPEWLLILDVDEFPVVRGGHLSGLRGMDQVDLLKIARYNYARLRDETEAGILGRLAAPAAMPLIVERRDVMRAQDTDPTSGTGPRWTFHGIAPRVMVRPARIARLEIGAHKAGAHQTGPGQGAGDAPRQVQGTEICVVHLPFTSFARFTQKLRNIDAHLSRANFMTGPRGWHWKWWLERFRAGALAEEFEREGLAADEFAALCTSGAIRTAAQVVGEAPPEGGIGGEA